MPRCYPAGTTPSLRTCIDCGDAEFVEEARLTVDRHVRGGGTMRYHARSTRYVLVCTSCRTPQPQQQPPPKEE